MTTLATLSAVSVHSVAITLFAVVAAVFEMFVVDAALTGAAVVLVLDAVAIVVQVPFVVVAAAAAAVAVVAAAGSVDGHVACAAVPPLDPSYSVAAPLFQSHCLTLSSPSCAFCDLSSCRLWEQHHRCHCVMALPWQGQGQTPCSLSHWFLLECRPVSSRTCSLL